MLFDLMRQYMAEGYSREEAELLALEILSYENEDWA